MTKNLVCKCGHSLSAHEWTGFGKAGCQYCDCDKTIEGLEIDALKETNVKLRDALDKLNIASVMRSSWDLLPEHEFNIQYPTDPALNIDDVYNIVKNAQKISREVLEMTK